MRHLFVHDCHGQPPSVVLWSMRPLLTLLVCWCAVGCDLGVDVRSLTDLEKAEAKWGREGPKSYTYAVERLCYCPVEAIGPVWVFVARGEVVTWTYVESGNAVPESMQRFFPTVDSIFGILREAYAREAHEVTVSYHEDLGYPTEFWIDYEEMMADEELGMRITEEPRRSILHDLAR